MEKKLFIVIHMGHGESMLTHYVVASEEDLTKLKPSKIKQLAKMLCIELKKNDLFEVCTFTGMAFDYEELLKQRINILGKSEEL
jgi:hypothetical protein